MKRVPFFNYPYIYQRQRDELLSVIDDVGKRGAFIMQRDLADFERSLAEYTGARYAVGVANATDGLQMLLMAGGIGPGDEVIICSHTMVATASAIHFTGAIPIPVEAGSDHLIDPSSVEAAITKRTRAMMPTQLNGRTCDMDAIQEIARKHNLQIYEDAAQALGSKYKGRSAGTFGIGGCISFYPAKNLGCLGDGGMVLCNDDEIYRRLLLMRDHGRDENGDVVEWGFNSRLDNLQAAILALKFKGYKDIVVRRRAIACMYQEYLGGLEEFVLPPAPESDPDHYDVFQNYEIEINDRDELQTYLAERGVGTLIQWGGKAIHHFTELGFTQELPFTDNLFKRLLMLPLNMSLTDEDVIYICEQIREFYCGK